MPDATKTVAEAGAVAIGLPPQAGDAFVSLLNGLGFGIKGKTQHLTWQQVEVKATPYAHEMATTLQGAMSSSQFHQLAQKFPLAYRDFLGSITWWDADGRLKYYNDFQKNIMIQKTDYDLVRQTIWEVAHWIIERVPQDRMDEAQEKINYFYAQALTPILQDLDVTFKSTTTVTGTPTAQTPTPANPPKPFGVPEWVLYLVAAGGLAGILLVAYGTMRR